MFSKSDDLPIDQVKAMRARGFDNNQIIQALQRNGYSSTQIFNALNQADLVSGAPVFRGVGQQPVMTSKDVGSGDLGVEQDYEEGGNMVGIGNEEIEELIESIIDEKWEELGKDINKVIEWKNEVETKIAKLEQRIDSLQDSFDKLHQAVIGKIGEYDKNILEVGAEVKAMEKVFSKVLPLFTENVSELARITQALKKS